MSLDLLALVTWMLFTLGIKAKEMDLKFQEGIKLANTEESLRRRRYLDGISGAGTFRFGKYFTAECLNITRERAEFTY